MTAAPFPRDKRAIVYQRAKRALDKRPFGTHRNVYLTHYEWMHHSMAPRPPAKDLFRLIIGGAAMHPALFGLGPQYFRHELRLALRQRHPRTEQGRQDGRLRP